MNRSFRQLWCCLVVGLAAWGVGAAPVAAVAEPPLEQLIVSGPPAGYVDSVDPAALSGAYTLDQLGTATGTSASPSVMREAARMQASVRTWDAADGSRLLLLLIRMPEDGDAAEFLDGLLSEFEDAASYDTGVKGTTGRIVFGGMPSRLVAWHQGRYAVQLFSSAATGVAAEAAALQVTTAQIERLRATGGDPSASTTEPLSPAFVVGAVGVVALFVVFVIYRFIRSRRKPPPPVVQPWMMDRHRSYVSPASRLPWQQGIPTSPPAPPPPGTQQPPR